jgi:hypothetical protein
MLRLRDAIWWFFEALGRAPVDDDLAFGVYREIEFRRASELSAVRATIDGIERSEDPLRRAS